MSDYISNENTEQIYVKRLRCQYDLLEREIIELRKQNILNELKILNISGKSIIYENQEIIASKVVAEFKNRKIINVMVVSKTQSGKTGSMCATIKKYLEDTDNLIPIENIYIITGLSSCEWKEQTKDRTPESMQSRVFHRCELPNTFVDEIKYKKNILIIMDEIQVAAKKGQTIYNMFKNAGLLDKSRLYENDVKILEYTATPDGTIYDLMKWNDASNKILAQVGDGYVSSYDLYTEGRVKQYNELSGYDKKTGQIDNVVFGNIQEIKDDVDSYDRPLYHIVRTKNGIEQDVTIHNFKKIFSVEDCDFVKYDGESEIVDINKTLKIEPTKHTIIFIKEMLRCAKTLEKKYIGVCYERFSKTPDDSSIIQGLVGRGTGYDDNGISIYYTNVESVEKYEKLWETEFEDKSVNWNSKTTKYTDGVLTGKNTFNDPKDYEGFSVESDDDNTSSPEPEIKKFETQNDVKKYYISVLKPIFGGNGPNKHPGENENGFYPDTNVKRVLSANELYNKRKDWLKKQKRPYRLRPCYRDVTDKTTLEWWLIYKKIDQTVSEAS